jgi:ketosteroid isomerase-like protein
MIEPDSEKLSPVAESRAQATLREYLEASEQLDPVRAAACFADDAEILGPEGRFAGRASIDAYLRWSLSRLSSASMQPLGDGARVVGDVAVEEFVQSGISVQGFRFETTRCAITEFDAEGKIRRRSTYWDRWPLIYQTAHQTGGLSGRMARSFVDKVDQNLTVDMLNSQ